MKIGILQCDDVRPELLPAYGNYPVMFETLFSKVDADFEYQTWRVLDGKLPESTELCDGWLITGSRHAAYESHDWMLPLFDFIRTLHQQDKKLIGICFGHQAVAEALGGTVVNSDKGWGLGVAENQVVQKKSWMQPGTETFALLVSHQDQVVEPGNGGVTLIESDFCPHFMVQYNENMLTIQGHPEFSCSLARDLMELRRESVEKDVVDEAIASLLQPVDDIICARWMVHFFKGL